MSNQGADEGSAAAGAGRELLAAAEAGDSPALRAALMAGADPNFCEGGKGALAAAAAAGHVEAMKVRAAMKHPARAAWRHLH